KSAVDRRSCVAYLAAECECLAEDARAIRQEFDALRRADFETSACTLFRHRLRAHRGMLANHAIALNWTFHPPNSRFGAEPCDIEACLSGHARKNQTQTRAPLTCFSRCSRMSRRRGKIRAPSHWGDAVVSRVAGKGGETNR